MRHTAQHQRFRGIVTDETQTTQAPAFEPAHDPATGAHTVRVADGELTVAARDAVTLASEADSLVLTAATEIVLSVGQSTLTLRADGTILLNGRRMTLNAPAMIDINPDPPPAGPGDEPNGPPNGSVDDGPAAGPRPPCGCQGAPREPAQ